MGKGQKLCPAHHRSMESPGKYSLYPQRPREECGPGLDMLRAIRPDRGVLICFRLTWTAAKIRAELGNHDVQCGPGVVRKEERNRKRGWEEGEGYLYFPSGGRNWTSFDLTKREGT